MQDLWPSTIGERVDDSPVSIMRDQAKLLGQKTHNLVEAEVGTGSPQDGNFIYHFYIVAPTVNDYHFRLFTVEHGIEMYPLTIYVDEPLGLELGANIPQTITERIQRQDSSIRAIIGLPHHAPHHILTIGTKADFVDYLKKILGSNRAQQVISTLLSQINADYQPVSV